MLNQLLRAQALGANRTWEDAEALIQALKGLAASLRRADAAAASYVENEVVQLMESYLRTLRIADYPASAFFDREISVDTGPICNLGRAFREYKALASRPDLPLTPQNERAFGLFGELAEEGEVWRIAVSPWGGADLAANARGRRNAPDASPSILVERLDLAMTATAEGQSRERFSLAIQNVERIDLKQGRKQPMIPGHLGGA